MFLFHRRILSLPVPTGSLSFLSSRKGTPTYFLFPHLLIVTQDGAGLIEPNTVKKHSGEKPHAKEIDTHNTNDESTVFHYAATPLHL